MRLSVCDCRGRWLERADLEVNMAVRVEVSDRRLMLEVCEPESPLHCAEPNCPYEAKAKRGTARAEL
jgi:hypothetical protein